MDPDMQDIDIPPHQEGAVILKLKYSQSLGYCKMGLSLNFPFGHSVHVFI